MALKNTAVAYGAVAKFFHWLIFLLLLFMIVFGYFLADIPKEYQPLTYNLHKLTGLTILVLMILRGIWSSLNPKPMLPIETPDWQRIAERIVHYLLYFTVIAMPLAGWVGACAGGRPPHLGNIQFNLPIEKNKELAEMAFTLHGYLAIAIIVIVAIHLVAALYHHFIKRDNILRRMLPGISTHY